MLASGAKASNSCNMSTGKSYFTGRLESLKSKPITAARCAPLSAQAAIASSPHSKIASPPDSGR